MKKILVLLLSLLLVNSCGQQAEEETTENDELKFFDVVYEGLTWRPIGNDTWIQSTGERLMKFETTTVIGDEEVLPENLEGTFAFSLGAYKKISTDPSCEGKYQGTFLLKLFETNTIGEVAAGDDSECASSWGVYCPYDPNPDSTIDPEDQVDNIRTYQFEMKITQQQFFPTNCESPFITHDLKVVRFPNGTLIVDDTSKGLQYFFRPKLRVER
jgi:hypothetical protein